MVCFNSIVPSAVQVGDGRAFVRLLLRSSLLLVRKPTSSLLLLVQRVFSGICRDLFAFHFYAGQGDASSLAVAGCLLIGLTRLLLPSPLARRCVAGIYGGVAG